MLNFLLYSLNGKQNNSGLQTLETPMSTSEKLSSVNRLKGDACNLHGVWLLEQSTFSQCERKNMSRSSCNEHTEISQRCAVVVADSSESQPPAPASSAAATNYAHLL